MPETPEILAKAADVIEARGWYQGDWVPYSQALDFETCPVCVLGAINVAADYAPDGVLEEEDDDRAVAARALADHLGLPYTAEDIDTVAFAVGDQWNDLVATSAEQVIAALRECAASLKAGAS